MRAVGKIWANGAVTVKETLSSPGLDTPHICEASMGGYCRVYSLMTVEIRMSEVRKVESGFKTIEPSRAAAGVTIRERTKDRQVTTQKGVDSGEQSSPRPELSQHLETISTS